jgi:hypothetical protein
MQRTLLILSSLGVLGGSVLDLNRVRQTFLFALLAFLAVQCCGQGCNDFGRI